MHSDPRRPDRAESPLAPERRNQNLPFTVHFLLVEGFSMMALSSAIEPLRAANRLLGRQRYAWALVSKTGGSMTASNGIELPVTHGIADAPPSDLTLVVASLALEDYGGAEVFGWLRRLRRQGRLIGAISIGAMVLAQAGVARNARVTVHWEIAGELAEGFPDIEVVPDLYCWDKGILTAAGGTAAMDLMLALIAEMDGRKLALDVADQFLHGEIRPSSRIQRQDLRSRYRVTDERLLAALALMEARIADPARLGALAEAAGLSERQLERLFVAQLGLMPSAFYMDLRLNAARRMILASTEVLETIAERCGFSSLGHFSRAYKARFGEAPSHLRRRRSQRHDGFVQGDGEPR